MHQLCNNQSSNTIIILKLFLTPFVGPEEQMEMLAPRPVVSAKPTEELAVLC